MIQKWRGQIEAFDWRVVRATLKWRHPAITLFFRPLTWTGTGYGWLVAGIILALANRQGIDILPQQGLFFCSMTGAFYAWVIGLGLKKYFNRKRPFEVLPNFQPLTLGGRDGSFPSSHASSSTAFFLALYLGGHPYGGLAGLWCALIIASRLYLGVHFPSDLIVGVLLGCVCGPLGAYTAHWLQAY